jgi:tRNA (guanine37-N1)-methyltransferase
MVMLAQPLEAAWRAVKATQNQIGLETSHTILLSPQGQPFTHEKVKQLATLPSLVLVCGRYEAIDQRFIDRCVDEEISIGDFVVSGGELPAMLLIDAVIRQRPGVLGDEKSAQQDSFVGGVLDYPHYTRPPVYEGVSVPEVLLEGNHARIEAWRREQALLYTQEKRPDLIEKVCEQGKLSQADLAWLNG